MLEQRSVNYRGSTREEAERQYHREARQAADEGYVPTSEDWSVALGQQVLTVSYSHAPDQAPAVLRALKEIESIPSASVAIPPVAVAPPAVVPPAAKSSNWTPLGLVVAVVVLGAIAWQMGLGRSLTPGVGVNPIDAPPVGQIWFGNSFDPSSFAISGRKTSTTTGSAFAFVAHLTKSIGSGDANMQIALNGTTLANQALTVQGSGDFVGLTYVPPIAGTYTFTIADLGGNTLSTGSITVQ